MPKIIDHDARRRELIEASWNVIATDGLDGLTMRKIATAAGCTTGRLTHYFENREALVLAALRAVYEAAGARMTHILTRGLTPTDTLRDMLEETLPLDDIRLQEWKVWIAFWTAASTDKVLAAENDARHTLWRKALLPLIAAIAPRADAMTEADALIGIVNGLGLLAAVSPTRGNRIRAKSALSHQIARLADCR